MARSSGLNGTWQLYDGVWHFGKKIRGIIRHPEAQAWSTSLQSQRDGYKKWFWKINGTDRQGGADDIISAITAAEQTLREVKVVRVGD